MTATKHEIFKWAMDKGHWVSRNLLAKELSEKTGVKLTLSQTEGEDDWTVVNHKNKIMYYATPSQLLKVWETGDLSHIKSNIVYVKGAR